MIGVGETPTASTRWPGSRELALAQLQASLLYLYDGLRRGEPRPPDSFAGADVSLFLSSPHLPLVFYARQKSPGETPEFAAICADEEFHDTPEDGRSRAPHLPHVAR